MSVQSKTSIIHPNHLVYIFFKEYDYPRDFFLGMTYSEKLSEIFSMDVYLWWYEGRWCLYLLEKDRKI